MSFNCSRFSTLRNPKTKVISGLGSREVVELIESLINGDGCYHLGNVIINLVNSPSSVSNLI